MPELSSGDRRAIGQLSTIAVSGAELETDGRSRVECWRPSENLLSEGDAGVDSGFRVLCRVHYEQAHIERYRDMICIGSLHRDPVADYCYRWAYYTGMPKFEDQPGYFFQ